MRSGCASFSGIFFGRAVCVFTIHVNLPTHMDYLPDRRIYFKDCEFGCGCIIPVDHPLWVKGGDGMTRADVRLMHMLTCIWTSDADTATAVETHCGADVSTLTSTLRSAVRLAVVGKKPLTLHALARKCAPTLLLATDTGFTGECKCDTATFGLIAVLFYFTNLPTRVAFLQAFAVAMSQEDLNEALEEACRANCYKSAEMLLKYGASPRPVAMRWTTNPAIHSLILSYRNRSKERDAWMAAVTAPVMPTERPLPALPKAALSTYIAPASESDSENDTETDSD